MIFDRVWRSKWRRERYVNKTSKRIAQLRKQGDHKEAGDLERHMRNDHWHPIPFDRLHDSKAEGPLMVKLTRSQYGKLTIPSLFHRSHFVAELTPSRKARNA